MSRRKKTNVCFTKSFESIDTEKRVLKGVVIVEEGEAKGHGVMLDKKFVQDVVSKGKEYGDVGVKSRFGHPNMCSDALGTYLGRYKNFRLRRNSDSEDHGYQAIADLYFDESASQTPNGDLAGYILKLAETAPEHFGNSIVFTMGDIMTKKEKDENGNEFNVHYATIDALHESDLVDSPAATSGLFHQMTAGEMASQVTEFLDDNPKVFDLIDEKPEIIDEFLSRYKEYKSIKNQTFTKMKKFLMSNFPALAAALGFKGTEEVEITEQDLTKANDELSSRDQKITELTAERDAANGKVQQLEADRDAAQANFTAEKEAHDAAKTQVTSLQAEIQTLKDENARIQAGQTKTDPKDDPSLADKDRMAAAEKDAESFRNS